MKRKIVSLLLALAVSVSVTACADGTENTESTQETSQESGSSENQESKASAESSTESIAPENTPAVEMAREDAILFRQYYADVYYGLDQYGEVYSEYPWKETCEALLKQGKDFSNATIFAIGDGVVYFYQYEYSNDCRGYHVYAVDVNEKKYQEIWSSPENWWLDSIDYYNGKLFVTTSNDYAKEEHVYVKDASFQFREESSPSKQVLPKLEGYNVTVYSTNLGNRYGCCSITRSFEENGYVIGYKDQHYYKISKDGDISVIAGMPEDYVYVPAYDKDAVIYSAVDENTGTSGYYCVKLSDGSRDTIVKDDRFFTYLAYEGGKVYYAIRSENPFVITNHEVCQYDVATGSDERLYSEDTVPGATLLEPGTEGFQVIRGEIYFLKLIGDEVHYVLFDTKSKSGFQDMGLVVDKKSVFQYGTVVYEANVNYCPYCGTPLEKDYQEEFQIDPKYSAKADVINQKLRLGLQWVLDGKNVTLVESNEDCGDHKENPTIWCMTMEAEISDVKILSDRYLAVDYSGYWYGGGAHGMPSISQRLFDLQTGEELAFEHFYGDSDEKFKKLVAEKTKQDFLSYEEGMSPYFAEDAQTVYNEAYELADMKALNILFDEKGVSILYSPYDMGPYASGFIEIFISYEELLGRPEL